MTASTPGNLNILFIGGGKMMQAIGGGLIARGLPPANLHVVEPDNATRVVLAGQGMQVAANGQDMLANIGKINVLILAVKPQHMRTALTPFAGMLGKQLVVSIAAGIRTQELSGWLRHANVVRAMPNTPALIQAGISGLYAGPAVGGGGRALAESLMAAVGGTAWFEKENMLDAVTAVSGSGPAYVFYAMEALEEAATTLGFSPEAARQFALETFRGAALLAAQSAASPAQLRANVTSKGGTTEAAIAAFDRAGLRADFVAGVLAAAARATELGEEFAMPALPSTST